MIEKGCGCCRDQVVCYEDLEYALKCELGSNFEPSELYTAYLAERERAEKAEQTANRLTAWVHCDDALTASLKEDIEQLQAENAKLRKALELACAEIADHDCPHEYDLIEREECKSCPRGNEERYDVERDIKCWMRHFLEKVEGGGEQ